MIRSHRTGLLPWMRVAKQDTGWLDFVRAMRWCERRFDHIFYMLHATLEALMQMSLMADDVSRSNTSSHVRAGFTT